jgi:muramoyltetrapeptide carboxypeptidase
MLDDDEVKAIIIARGGYGTVRVIDQLDFTSFLQKPKWICGYSDITILHAHINTLGIASIHSTMPISFPEATQEALLDLQLALTGQLKKHEVSHAENDKWALPITSQLPILGGNLSVLYSMLGSRSLAQWEAATTAGYFLFIEDVDEMHYHIDRMMMALLRADILKNARAIICGGMTQMKDNTVHFGFTNDNPWGYDAMATVKRVAEKLNIPVVSNFPAGHQNDNRAFYVGVPATINQAKEKVTIEYHV